MSDTDSLPEDSEQELTVDEFCRRLSISDRRVELLGAFHFDEKRNGRVKDTETNFRARFDEFVNKPV